MFWGFVLLFYSKDLSNSDSSFDFPSDIRTLPLITSIIRINIQHNLLSKFNGKGAALGYLVSLWTLICNGWCQCLYPGDHPLSSCLLESIPWLGCNNTLAFPPVAGGFCAWSRTHEGASQWSFASLLCPFIGIGVLDCNFSLPRSHILTFLFIFDYDIKDANFHKNLEICQNFWFIIFYIHLLYFVCSFTLMVAQQHSTCLKRSKWGTVDLTEHVHSSVQIIIHMNHLCLPEGPSPRNSLRISTRVRILDKYFPAMLVLLLTNQKKQVPLTKSKWTNDNKN